MAFAYGGRKRTEYRAYLYRMKPALSAVYSGLTRVPIYTDAVLARHVPQPRRTHTGAFQFAPDASDDDFDDIDAAPAEPAHASSSATSTSAAGQDVSTSTQPSVTMLNSVTCVSSLHARASLWCLAATRGSAATVLTLSVPRWTAVAHFVAHRSRWFCVF